MSTPPKGKTERPATSCPRDGVTNRHPPKGMSGIRMPHARPPPPHHLPFPLPGLSPQQTTGLASAPPPPCVTFRPVVVSLRGPGQSPVLPFACCVGSLFSVGICGRCSCWCRFRLHGAPPPPPIAHGPTDMRPPPRPNGGRSDLRGLPQSGMPCRTGGGGGGAPQEATAGGARRQQTPCPTDLRLFMVLPNADAPDDDSVKPGPVAGSGSNTRPRDVVPRDDRGLEGFLAPALLGGLGMAISGAGAAERGGLRTADMVGLLRGLWMISRWAWGAKGGWGGAGAGAGAGPCGAERVGGGGGDPPPCVTFRLVVVPLGGGGGHPPHRNVPRAQGSANSIAFGSAPQREADSQPISRLVRPAVSQTVGRASRQADRNTQFGFFQWQARLQAMGMTGGCGAGGGPVAMQPTAAAWGGGWNPARPTAGGAGRLPSVPNWTLVQTLLSTNFCTNFVPPPTPTPTPTPPSKR